MSDPYETTGAHLGRLLGRALNSFDLPDELVERLGTALAHRSSLHTARRSPAAGPWREIHRHAYLLSDGDSLVLWELAHRQEDDLSIRYEVFASKAETCLAAARLFGEIPSQVARELGEVTVEEDPESDISALSKLFTNPTPAQRHRDYAVQESADHARRVLRRAENPDRPGERVALLLRSAYAHQISQVFGARQCLADGRAAGFSLYEHSFVLLDGSEFSLWEVEHTVTPDGRHMCEVYESETAAHGAMELRARVR
ncbi:DUF6227 family protein [Streptomyces sp. H27-H1]|uniref:DUF6227 family protein n=1 Tax=Streptomyces sp. H27-H1 TaxID=2996461 RepID=UPI002270D232|nr:DUF6227 family protein [Streptomyces sp. H27-H1]MCY0932238.1 DUF6227 family protein [Streptomyces sp. H27-H1]